MSGRLVTAWTGAVGILLFGAGLWVSPIPRATDAVIVRAPATSELAEQSMGEPTELRSNPFREDRGPAAVRYRPLDSTSAHPVAPADDYVPAPDLLLEGLVAGPLGGAIVRGVPAVHEAVLIRVGESAHGLQITAIRGDTVWLSGLGSTWQLPLRRPW